MSGMILKITIEGTHPPVWRRVALPEKSSFYDLHRVIQEVFGWSGYHMHEFRSSDGMLRVGDLEENESPWDAVLPEEETLVEDFLQQGKWMRYTYDFGDDWRHKILFEKTDENYGSRYAAVLKWKGENFAEDSGGVWGWGYDTEDEEEGGEKPEPDRYFDLAEVNQNLAKREIPVRKSGEKAKKRLSGEMDGISLDDLADGPLLRQLAERLGLMFPDHGESEVDQDLAAWWAFCEEASAGIGPDCRAVTADGEHLMQKMAGSEPMSALLCRQDSRGLWDYCWYLGISEAPGESRAEMAGWILGFLEEHLEYYFYTLREEDFRFLLSLNGLGPGAAVGKADPRSIARCAMLGFLRVRIVEEGRKKTAELTLASDAPALLERLNRLKWKNLCRTVGKQREELCWCMMAYGAVEEESLFRIFTEVFQVRFTGEEFHRFLYWCCVMAGDVRTVLCEGETRYLLLYEMEDEVIWLQREYASDLPYCPLDREEISEYRKGISAAGECWELFAGQLREEGGMDAEEICSSVEHVFGLVVNGGEFPDVWDTVKELLSPETLEAHTDAWLIAMQLCMETPLPMLKGYSRTMAEVCYGKAPWELGLFVESGEPDWEEEPGEDGYDGFPQEFGWDSFLENGNGGRKPVLVGAREVWNPSAEQDGDSWQELEGSLGELPGEVQCRIYRALALGEEDAIRTLEQVLEEAGGRNQETMFLLSFQYLYEGKLDQAESLLKKLKKRKEEDSSIRNALGLLSQFRESEEEEKGFAKWIQEQHSARFSDASGHDAGAGNSGGNWFPEGTDIGAASSSDAKMDRLEQALDRWAMWGEEDGDWQPPKPYRREQPKVGRNAPCPCGSGKKYKKCCGR